MNIANDIILNTDEEFKNFILCYKRNMHNVNLEHEAIIDVLSELNGISSEVYKEFHNVILNNSMSKLEENYKLSEIYDKMLMPYSIIKAMNSGIDCSILFEEKLSEDVLYAYIEELVKGRDISLYSFEQFDECTIKTLGVMIYELKVFPKDLLKKTTPISLLVLSKLYTTYKDAYDDIDVYDVTDLYSFRSIDAIGTFKEIRELLPLLRNSEFKDLTIILLADLIPGLDDEEKEMLKELIKVYSKDGDFDLCVEACFKLIINSNIELNLFSGKQCEMMLADYNQNTSSERTKGLASFIIYLKSKGVVK